MAFSITLGSYEVSRSYFAQVVANPNVPPEIAAKVRLYLQQLAIEAQPPPFSATIFSGIRWESNANSAPASQAVTLNGIDFTLDTQSVAAPDWSAVNIGTMHYGYDLKNQGDRIEFDAITYNADYFHLTDIDLNFFEATLGPSFNMKRIGWDKTRFYVYGIGDEVLLGNDQYFAAGGGGVDMTASYEGHAIGNVATNIGGNGWVTYVATGDMYMDWDFNARSGNLSIYHFDRSITPGGLTFGGTMTTPGELTGKNTFGGPLSLSGDLPNNLNELNGMTGSATGSFVIASAAALARAVATESAPWLLVSLFAGVLGVLAYSTAIYMLIVLVLFCAAKLLRPKLPGPASRPLLLGTLAAALLVLGLGLAFRNAPQANPILPSTCLSSSSLS